MIVMSELRKERLMREALGPEPGEMAGIGDLWHIAGVIALILIVVIFGDAS